MNWQTAVVLVVLAGIASTLVIKMILDRKKGKTSCACGCKECAFHDKCNSKK